MPITDNRTLVADAESLAPVSGGDWIDDADGTMGIALDTDTFVEGVSSAADRISASRAGIGWREDADRDWSGNVFYIWWRSDVGGKLGTKQNGGVTVRFTGATVTDWFEVYIDGSDTYGGGFRMSVVDIDLARSLAVTGAAQSPHLVGNTNGTPPATTAIRRVIVMWDVLTTAPGGADNHFVDAIWRLPVGTPGIIVDGDNAGSPYTWQDILDAGDNADPTKAWGVSRQDSGVIFINTPIQFGGQEIPSPLPVHSFSDTNKIIAWESQLVNDGFYGFTVTGHGLGGQQFLAGVTDGNTGSQGWVVTAEQPDGPRWFIDASDRLTDTVGFYGCSLLHTNIIDIDNPSVEMLNSLLIDGQRLWHSR